MAARPRRISMGCYQVEASGKKLVLQRCGRSGFRMIMRPGAISPLFKRLRDAAAAAKAAAEGPWPFDVEKVFDAKLDLPHFLRRAA